MVALLVQHVAGQQPLGSGMDDHVVEPVPVEPLVDVPGPYPHVVHPHGVAVHAVLGVLGQDDPLAVEPEKMLSIMQKKLPLIKKQKSLSMVKTVKFAIKIVMVMTHVQQKIQNFKKQ